MARRLSKEVARRRALDVMQRHKGGALTDRAMKIALEAQRWARRKPKARAQAKLSVLRVVLSANVFVSAYINPEARPVRSPSHSWS